MAEGEIGSHGVLPPDGSGIWHMVEWPLAPQSLCGMDILYGAKLKEWAETPLADRCGFCLRRFEARGKTLP